MGYLVLSRKYRPQRFEEVVRQEHVTRTLANALTAGRLAHAILFSGPRGTGKTTIARILAKCVNCASGPTATPCNECRSCREITEGHAPDVFEIDGASNNKVENVRDLRENANYMPAHSPFKIYIIDEVHMLSDSAFNALLKIIEEPPDHVMFFFATTEPNKIPITILSRCQRHDLRRIDIDAIIKHMAMLCQKEGIDISREGLTIIARQADGSIRDALSLLDQIISGAAGTIDTDLITDIAGGIDRQTLFDISEAVFCSDAGKIIETIDRLYEHGQHMTRLFAELLQHFRNLLLVRMGAGARALADVPDHEIKKMREQVKDIPETRLNQILDLLFREEAAIKLSLQPKLALELAFIRVLQAKPALPLDLLIEKIDHLQKGIARPVDPGTGDRVETDGYRVQEEPSSFEPAVKKKAPPKPEPADEKPAPGPADAPNEALPDSPNETDPAEMKQAETASDAWKKILNLISRGNPRLAACFVNSNAVLDDHNRIAVDLKSNRFNINYAKRDDNRLRLKKACSDVFGREMAIELHGKPLDPGDAQARKKEAEQLKKEALNHPMIENAMKIFNGRIVDIKIL